MKTKMISRLFCMATVLVCLSSSASAGYIEICKDAVPVGSLSGLYSFTVAGQAGTFDTPAGACTLPFQLPDGIAAITEVFQSGSMLVAVSTFPDERLISFNLATRTATVQILAGDLSNETVVSFANAPQSQVPEPATAWLLGSGVALFVVRRKAARHPLFAPLRGPVLSPNGAKVSAKATSNSGGHEPQRKQSAAL